MSWKPEVLVSGETQWCSNALRFATEREARANVQDLAFRWLAVREWRAVESSDPVNYAYEGGALRRLEQA